MTASPRVPTRLVPLRVRARTSRQGPKVRTRALLRVAAFQHRTVLVLGVVVLALLALWTHEVVAQAVAAHARVVAAHCPGGPYSACLDALDQAQPAIQDAQLLQYALVATPALAGLFLGAPLVAREFEQGTYQLVWSQSVSPQRWLRGQLLVVCGAALSVGGVCAALGLWLHTAVTPAFAPALGGFTLLPYNATGPVLAASVLLAVALGVAAGTLIRRTLPAMGVTLALYGAAMACLTWLRQWLQPVHHLLTNHGYNLAPDDWLLRDGVQLADGRRLLYAQCEPTCPNSAPTFEDYHTANQLWPMQWTEAGIMALLALLALAVAHRALRRPRA